MKRKSKTLALLWFVITGIWIVTLTLTLLSENRSGLLIGAQIACIAFSLITAILNIRQF